MTERCDCDLCKIGAALSAMLKTLDDLPEIGTSFYDDPISEIYNAIEENVHIFECDFAYDERMKGIQNDTDILWTNDSRDNDLFLSAKYRNKR